MLCDERREPGIRRQIFFVLQERWIRLKNAQQGWRILIQQCRQLIPRLARIRIGRKIGRLRARDSNLQEHC